MLYFICVVLVVGWCFTVWKISKVNAKLSNDFLDYRTQHWVLNSEHDDICNQRDEAEAAFKVLRDAILDHRMATEQNMCWENDEKLWSVLKDGKVLDHTRPTFEEWAKGCAKYWTGKPGFDEKKLATCMARCTAYWASRQPRPPEATPVDQKPAV